MRVILFKKWQNAFAAWPLVEGYDCVRKMHPPLLFKIEGMTAAGAFKIRGAVNTLLKLQENRMLPEHVVTFSSGNHARGVAYVCHALRQNGASINLTVCMEKTALSSKIETVRSLGAVVKLFNTRADAEAAVQI